MRLAGGIQFRAFKLDVRQVDEGKPGHVVFHSSVFGKKDSYGTIFDKGCFAQTIQQHDALFPVLWFHNPREPIALGVHEEDDKGLQVTADLNLDVETARNVHSGLKAGYVDCASIAFSVITEAIEDEDTHFKEVRLWESSLLTKNFAAQAEATVDSVRAIPDAIARLTQNARDMGAEELQAAIVELRELLDDLVETAVLPEDGRPYPNEHSCRLKSPDDYKTCRRMQRKHDGKVYYVILCQRKDDLQKWEDQAFRYPKATWSVDEASVHCKGHGGKFEAAKEKAAGDLSVVRGSPAEMAILHEQLRQTTDEVQSVTAALVALTPKAPQGTLGGDKAQAGTQKTVEQIVADLRSLRVGISHQ